MESLLGIKFAFPVVSVDITYSGGRPMHSSSR